MNKPQTKTTEYFDFEELGNYMDKKYPGWSQFMLETQLAETGSYHGGMADIHMTVWGQYKDPVNWDHDSDRAHEFKNEFPELFSGDDCHIIVEHIGW